jgi:ketosteroid isomerase-like protein
MTPSRRARSSLPLVAALAFGAMSVAHAQGIETPRVPLRTAIREINTLRAEYADLYNKKDAAALAAMYLPDAVVIHDDGSALVGRAAIGKALAEGAANWTQLTISSDTMRVFGNTAWDVGTLSRQGSGGDPSVSHYLVVLRRGVATGREVEASVSSMRTTREAAHAALRRPTHCPAESPTTFCTGNSPVTSADETTRTATVAGDSGGSDSASAQANGRVASTRSPEIQNGTPIPKRSIRSPAATGNSTRDTPPKVCWTPM